MLIFININLYNCSSDYLYSFCVVCPLLCAVFHLIVVLFCVMCVICFLCLIVNHCHPVKTHLQLISITLHYIIFHVTLNPPAQGKGYLNGTDYSMLKG
jgi:hypothetical protein